MIKEVERFTVQTDDGTKHTVIVYQKFLKAGDQVLPGLKELRTSEGYHLNRIDDDTFEILELDQIARRVR